jgi:hypothetical protein
VASSGLYITPHRVTVDTQPIPRRTAPAAVVIAAPRDCNKSIVQLCCDLRFEKPHCISLAQHVTWMSKVYIGIEKGSGRIVSRIADLIVGQVVPFEFVEFIDCILHGYGILLLS